MRETEACQLNNMGNVPISWRMPMVDLARKLDMTPAAVSYAVQRGEKMAKKQGCRLESEVI